VVELVACPLAEPKVGGSNPGDYKKITGNHYLEKGI
jgi:hypothetical protein